MPWIVGGRLGWPGQRGLGSGAPQAMLLLLLLERVMPWIVGGWCGWLNPYRWHPDTIRGQCHHQGTVSLCPVLTRFTHVPTGLWGYYDGWTSGLAPVSTVKVRSHDNVEVLSSLR